MNITTHCYSVSSQHEPIFSFFPFTLPLCDLSIHIKTEHQQCTALIDLWQLANGLEHSDSKLPEQLLSETEQTYFERFSYPKRRREWLGGRIAAKVAMLELAESDRLQDKLQHLSILPNEQGRPLADEISDIAISISHSSRFAVALAVKGATCGIDLQKESAKLPDLTDRFASAQELTILAGLPAPGDQVTRLTMLWAAKEALKKSILHDQPAIFSGIQVQQATVVRDHEYCFYCRVKGHPDQTAMVYNFSPYILSQTGANPPCLNSPK